MELVKISDVSKIYNPGDNEVSAIDNVSLTINKGEYVAIIGQSGSGKSTLMNILGCLDVPTKGEYLTDLKKIQDGSNKELIWLDYF